MDRQIESKCLELVENFHTLKKGNRMEYTEMLLACAELYMAAGREPAILFREKKADAAPLLRAALPVMEKVEENLSQAAAGQV